MTAAVFCFVSFLSSKAKNSQAAEAAQVVKPPGLKGLNSVTRHCNSKIDSVFDVLIFVYSSYLSHSYSAMPPAALADWPGSFRCCCGNTR